MNRPPLGLLKLVTLSAALGGCTLSVTASQPRPNIALSARAEKLTLQLKDNVRDTYQVPAQQGIKPINVNDWHVSLRAGFDAAFKNSFQGSGDQLVLSIERADLVLTPSAVGVQSMRTRRVSRRSRVQRTTVQSGVTAVRAQVTYRAQLLDKNGKVIGMSAATAESKGSTTVASEEEMTRLSGDAIETMYEMIAADLFKTPKPDGKQAQFP
jgi:hypothetical protein